MTDDEYIYYIAYGLVLLTFFIVLKMPKNKNKKDKNKGDKKQLDKKED